MCVKKVRKYSLINSVCNSITLCVFYITFRLFKTSLHFAKKMKIAQNQLEKLNFSITIPLKVAKRSHKSCYNYLKCIIIFVSCQSYLFNQEDKFFNPTIMKIHILYPFHQLKHYSSIPKISKKLVFFRYALTCNFSDE